MKPFNLEKALAGEPVRLKDGRKAKVVFQIPDALEFSGKMKQEYPLLGFIYNQHGELHRAMESWTIDGVYILGGINDECNIVGLWEEEEK